MVLYNFYSVLLNLITLYYPRMSYYLTSLSSSLAFAFRLILFFFRYYILFSLALMFLLCLCLIVHFSLILLPLLAYLFSPHSPLFFLSFFFLISLTISPPPLTPFDASLLFLFSRNPLTNALRYYLSHTACIF